MKGTLTALFALLVTLPLSVAAALDVQPIAITALEKISMKDDLGKENPKWKFVAGQWVRRPSSGRQVLADGRDTAVGRGAPRGTAFRRRRCRRPLPSYLREGGCERWHHPARQGWPQLSPREGQCAR